MYFPRRDEIELAVRTVRRGNNIGPEGVWLTAAQTDRLIGLLQRARAKFPPASLERKKHD